MMHAASQPGVLEWLLNALWLLLTLLAVWSVRRRPSRSELPNDAKALIALACAATVVFPVISLSDDLYSEQWATEARTLTISKQKHAAPCFCSTPTVVALTTLPHLSQLSRHIIAVPSAGQNAAPAFGYLQPSAGRAPPALPQPF